MSVSGTIRALGGAALYAWLLIFTSSIAATLTVPEQYPDIQSAITASAAGDTISVAAGIYKGSLNFRGKTVSLVSRSGAAKTSIVGVGAHAITFDGNGRTMLVSGFTIQSAATTIGAASITNAFPSLTDNRFVAGNNSMAAVVAITDHG